MADGIQGPTFRMSNKLILAVILQRQVIIPDLPIQLLDVAPTLVPRLVQQRPTQLRRKAKLPTPHEFLLLLVEGQVPLNHERLLHDFIIRPNLTV